MMIKQKYNIKKNIPLLLTQSAFKFGSEDWSLCSSIVSGSMWLMILEERLRLGAVVAGFSGTESDDMMKVFVCL